MTVFPCTVPVTMTPFETGVGTGYRGMIARSSLSSTMMLPWRQARRKSSAPAMREIPAAPLPAALMRISQVIDPRGVETVNPPSALRAMCSTGDSRMNAAPFSTAFSAHAIATSNGSTYPVEGHHNAQVACSFARGSSSLMREAPTISRPGTPFAIPFARSLSSSVRSSSENAKTIDPVRRKGNPSSSDHCVYSWHPRALTCAFMVPGAGSYPACTRPPFALVAPRAMSFPASMRQIDRSKRVS